MKPAARKRARQFAVQALYQWQLSGNGLTEIEQQFLSDFDFSKTDIDYFIELLHGIPAELKTIDDQFAPALDRSSNELDPIERAILRISTYELLKRLDIPYRVVINEGVELSKRFGATQSHKFINGVLDKTAHILRKVEIESKKHASDS